MNFGRVCWFPERCCNEKEARSFGPDMSESSLEPPELTAYRKYVKSRLDAIARIGVSASTGQFPEDLETSTEDDEFTQLYFGIKVMIDAMRSQLDAFRDLNHRLEDKVSERTAQLTESEKRHRAVSERYALAAAGTNEGLWDWNIDTGEIYYSLRWVTILGLDPGTVGTDSDEWFSRVHREDLKALLSAVYDTLKVRPLTLKMSIESCVETEATSGS